MRPTFPKILAEANACEYKYLGEEDAGMDFFPFSAFETAEETASWARTWTGNPTYTAREFLLFGKDGCGGYAALWLTNSEGTLEEQPVVFLGSEGETAVLARDLYDYLWLLAGGFGPQEAVFYPESRRVPVAAFERLAEKYAPTRRKTPTEVLAAAHDRFPGLRAALNAVCR